MKTIRRDRDAACHTVEFFVGELFSGFRLHAGF
jgi:hypothetical protein